MCHRLTVRNNVTLLCHVTNANSNPNLATLTLTPTHTLPQTNSAKQTPTLTVTLSNTNPNPHPSRNHKCHSIGSLAAIYTNINETYICIYKMASQLRPINRYCTVILIDNWLWQSCNCVYYTVLHCNCELTKHDVKLHPHQLKLYRVWVLTKAPML